jgi:hypothetical protein
MRKQLRLTAVAALAVTLIFTATSCDKEPVNKRPELPPVETMIMDFSDFTTQPAGTKGTDFPSENFIYSYLTVGYWSVSAVVITALPVAAYTNALTQTPEYLGDNTWEWSFEFPLNNLNYLATLTGTRINNEEFSVEMIIAQALLPNEGVKWFDGMVRYDHTSADWTFYKEGTIAVLEIEWNKDFVTEAADLTYTYTEPEQAETGSYIKWAYSPGDLFDAAYTVSMSEGMTNIEWNVSTIEGRVKAPAHFGDDSWHCWDSYTNGLADMECE